MNEPLTPATPEALAEVKESHTGAFLRELLGESRGVA